MTDFSSVLEEFKQNMSIYLDFIPITLTMMPMLSELVGTERLDAFVASKGRSRDDLNSKNISVFEFEISALPAYLACEREIASTARGVSRIPQIMIVGLISTYDFHIGQILRVVLEKRPETIFTSERNIKFSELQQYDSIEEARVAIIEKEIDSVLRLSHHEQFDWMERHFAIKLRADLNIWSSFVELCERRNLFTHTGGLVSSQYISVCENHKCLKKDIAVGDKLDVDPIYFESSVRSVYEIGVKLVYVLWRKFAQESSEKADQAANQISYDLIKSNQYALAERLLQFSADVVTRYRGNEKIRRMMIVNLANALKLQDRGSDAKRVLDADDWSAASDEFQLCVAAVHEDIDLVISLMKTIGSKGRPSREEYRDWPVFRSVKSNKKFTETFEEIFGEPLVSTQVLEARERRRVGSANKTLKADEGTNNGSTMH